MNGKFLSAMLIIVTSLMGVAGCANLASGQEIKLERERTQFRVLKLGNPNYFGTLPNSPFPIVAPIQANTSYEVLKCVGYNPDIETLEAVVYINRTSGYLGGICSAGSPEYVRFYLSYDNGVTWVDQGMEQFSAYDIPGSKPLEYAVTLWINPTNKICTLENLPTVRAILSWNDPPTANTPGFTPVWGNVLDARIQIAPWKFNISLLELLEGYKFDTKIVSMELLDLEAPVAIATPAPLALGELHDLYAETDVQPKRYLNKYLAKKLAAPSLVPMLTPQPDGDFPIPELPVLAEIPGVDWGDVIDGFEQTNNDTKYEELTCIGLDTVESALVGVVHLKRPTGYSGGLCTSGSTEYVRFWVDWGLGWNLAGTATINVHDISSIPSEGLMYAAYLPVDWDSHRRPCELGATTATVRAILSWNTPTVGPFDDPQWGNVKDTLVHIPPGPAVSDTDHSAYLQSLWGIDSCSIDQSTGYAETSPGERPFGGTIRVTGFILNPPDVLVADQFRYRLSRRQAGTVVWQPLSNTFNIGVIEQIGIGLPVGKTVLQEIQSDGFYLYREDPSASGGGWRRVTGNTLGYWNTNSSETALWEIMLEAKQGAAGVVYEASMFVCAADGTTRSTVKEYLDQVTPVPTLTITGFSETELGTVTDAADCETFTVGRFLHGTYTVSDEHFNVFTLVVKPVAPASGATVDPSSRAYPAVSTNGESGTWILDTTGMAACGYVIELHVRDRTIVSGSTYGRWDEVSVGFCLDE